MNAEQKLEWNTPELIVLVRSKPEEAVLTACKFGSVGIGTSQTGFGFCNSINGCLEACTERTTS